MSDALVEAVTRYTDARRGESPFQSAIEGLTFLRSDDAMRLTHFIYKPALCVVIQGAKQSMVGETAFECRAGQALVVSIEVPASGRIVQASPAKPYLALAIEFDPMILREVAAEMATPPASSSNSGPSIFAVDFDGPIADCVLRIVRLLETPSAIQMIYPLIMREICFWLLMGPQGAEIARTVLASGHEQSIIRAIHTLRSRFAEQIRIEDLAQAARMSPSAFHRQFKSVTAMTPLQYQKQLRLIEARRLMLREEVNVEMAALHVGYQSPSQFNRDYSRMFGKPPWRDVTQLRSIAA